MQLRTSCLLELNVPVASPFLLMLRPQSGDQQYVTCEEFTLSPDTPMSEFTDPFGNLCQRLLAPVGPFTIHATAEVEVANESDAAPGAWFTPVQELPEATLPFLLPSRYCESDRFGEMAASIASGWSPGYDQCAAIVHYIRGAIQYAPGCGQEIISAAEVNQRTQAVCRDLAHLGMALCRALSIPARMVVGYLEGLQPMDLHAWFEAYVGGRWYTFDPTQESLEGGRIAIAYGRDAADVAIYTQFGDPVPLLRMEVSVERM